MSAFASSVWLGRDSRVVFAKYPLMVHRLNFGRAISTGRGESTTLLESLVGPVL